MTEPLSAPPRARTRRDLLATDRSPQMRRRGARTVRTRTAAVPSLAVLTLGRAGFGARPGDIAAFQALGATDAQRLAAWVDLQLFPNVNDDPLYLPRLVAAGYNTLWRTSNQLWQANFNAATWEERIRPSREVLLVTFLRAVYSKWQLWEVISGFWHDHFNVYAYEYTSESLFPALDNVLRQHAFGNFRQMLEAVAKSTPMLYYLDNYTSSRGGPNENYSRELFELHTLGAENYWGVIPQSQVPRDDQGRPLGYVDADIYEATRCLTGWTYGYDDSWQQIPDTGEFWYHEAWHDPYPKRVLGLDLNAYQSAQKDGLDVLDALASHPGTGRYLARKLCRHLVSDQPPTALVDQVAAQFTALWQAPDQLRQVVRTILLSPEFAASWGQKVRRPFDLVVAAMRASEMEFPFRYDDADSDSFLWRFEQTGHTPFDWRPPDGYSDLMADWLSTEPRLHCWRTANWLVEVTDDLGHFRLDAIGKTLAAIPAGQRSAERIVDHWIGRAFGRSLDPVDREVLVEFMAAGYNPTFNLPLDADEDTQDRLRSLVALIFNMPDFVWR